jgi:hypothetical protein
MEKNNTSTTTTLHDIMVAPFVTSSSNILAAQVGTKDDTSIRKFQEVLLSEFFGERRKINKNVDEESTVATITLSALDYDTAKEVVNIDADYLKRFLIDNTVNNNDADNSPIHEWMMMGLITNETRYSSGRYDENYSVDARTCSIFPVIFLLLVSLGLATAAEKKLCRS